MYNVRLYLWSCYGNQRKSIWLRQRDPFMKTKIATDYNAWSSRLKCDAERPIIECTRSSKYIWKPERTVRDLPMHAYEVQGNGCLYMPSPLEWRWRARALLHETQIMKIDQKGKGNPSDLAQLTHTHRVNYKLQRNKTLEDTPGREKRNNSLQ